MGDEHVNATRGWVTAEIRRQMEPLQATLKAIQTQNAEQTGLLNDHIRVVDDFDHWRRALWGNGTGPKGFLELAREEDRRNQVQARKEVNERYDELLKEVGKLRAEGYREEGKTELREEQEKKKTVKLTRARTWMAIAATCAGAFGLDTVIKPLFHYLFSLLPR